LRAYDWPGNVRELENAIERALVLGASDEILPDDLPDSIVEAEGDRPGAATPFHDRIRQIKRQLVLEALRDAGDNYTEAARVLGLHPNNLHRLVRNLRLRPAKS
jgi:DNA-binding NtrC family response regulator